MARVECESAERAIRSVREARGSATAICWGTGSDGLVVALAATTPFGGVVRHWRGEARAFLDRLIAETEKAGAGDVYVAGPVPDPVFATEGFAGSRAAIPIREVEGRRMATWWSRLPRGGVDFHVGQELSVRIAASNGGYDVEYYTESGRGAGLHVRLRTAPDDRQRGVVARARAVIERVAFGMDFDADGCEVVTQVLMLRIPHELATAFPDAVLPKIREVV